MAVGGDQHGASTDEVLDRVLFLLADVKPERDRERDDRADDATIWAVVMSGCGELSFMVLSFTWTVTPAASDRWGWCIRDRPAVELGFHAGRFAGCELERARLRQSESVRAGSFEQAGRRRRTGS
jgi:hypothetical protein